MTERGGPRTSARSSSRRTLFVLLGLPIAIVVLAVSAFLIQRKPAEPKPSSELSTASIEPAAAAGFFGGAASCRVCHASQFAAWEGSQHAMAARLIDSDQDESAFVPGQEIVHGSFVSHVRRSADGFEIETVGREGVQKTFKPEAVLGVAPLRQYLIPFPGGRWQVSELAHDVGRGDWFDVFGDDDRQPHEWGFWANRGMNWNSQCAYCHMTDLDKGYDETKDTYNTTWQAWGISCEQCHGPMRDHALGGPAPGAALERETRNSRAMQVCASCHARRGEMTGAFKPGESFLDHYQPELPVHPEIYYPDGQVRDEDFEYGSFLLSRMHLSGITCLDCHDPHSGGLVAPLEDNALCLTCHTTNGKRPDAPAIEPLAHGHHAPGSEGNACVGCHMPVTVYMVRDRRRDHGFTSPDPLLTKRLGIPNACNRCHTDETADWALEWTDRWYGGRLTGAVRRRTLLVARAQDGDESVVPGLIEVAGEEAVPAWRAVLATLLGQWAHQEPSLSFLRGELAHDDPLVRAAAVQALSAIADARPWLRPLLEDPVRLVRLNAAWAFQAELPPNHAALRELERELAWQSDQPAGAWRRGEYARVRNRLSEAEFWLSRAVAWDPATAWFHHSLGVVYSLTGKGAEAELELETAGRLEPANREHPYTLALFHGEQGDFSKAAGFFERAVQVDPEFDRAWYNLGLARVRLGRPDDAIESLRRAEALAPQVADYPYARATIHFQRGDFDLARTAALQALEADPRYAPAVSMLSQIP